MKINSINNVTSQNNTNFGFNIRKPANADKLYTYWRDKGFSEYCIQKSMNKLENYATTGVMGSPFVRFFTSALGPLFEPRKKMLPAIDFLGFKTENMPKVGFIETPEGSYATTINQAIPNILYSFSNSCLQLPRIKVFKTPLTEFKNIRGTQIIEPKNPTQVVDEIVRNFKLFLKAKQPPHRYLPEKPDYYFDKLICERID